MLLMCFPLGINNSGQIALLDPVPFRLTPNMQRFIGPIGIEGVFTECIRATASIFMQVEKVPFNRIETLISFFYRATWDSDCRCSCATSWPTGL